MLWKNSIVSDISFGNFSQRKNALIQFWISGNISNINEVKWMLLWKRKQFLLLDDLDIKTKFIIQNIQIITTLKLSFTRMQWIRFEVHPAIFRLFYIAYHGLLFYWIHFNYHMKIKLYILTIKVNKLIIFTCCLQLLFWCYTLNSSFLYFLIFVQNKPFSNKSRRWVLKVIMWPSYLNCFRNKNHFCNKPRNSLHFAECFRKRKTVLISKTKPECTEAWLISILKRRIWMFKISEATLKMDLYWFPLLKVS